MSLTAIETVCSYHEQTKHHLNRYARSLGFMDWASQPDPYRRYAGAELSPLDHLSPADGPGFDPLQRPAEVPVQPVDRGTISQLFYDSLALSAFKQHGSEGWALRVNPSSGNLHPTEGYLIAGPIDGVTETAALCHYAPAEHGLEIRRRLGDSCWQQLSRSLPSHALLIGLTSLHWRESWKYGERAFRYCQHDVGHAVAAITYAAAALGWQVRLDESLRDDDLALLLGVHDQSGLEAEQPDCLLAVYPGDESPSGVGVAWNDDVAKELRACPVLGEPNRLSREHHPWPIIDQVAAATRKPQAAEPRTEPCWHTRPPTPPSPDFPDRSVSARKIIRQRRSAVAMDGTSRLDRAGFYRMLWRTCPAATAVPFHALPWKPAVHLALFVHRVDGLPPGLYLLARSQDAVEDLRAAMKTQDFLWTCPPECPEALRLYRLAEADCTRVAKAVSCHQEIASDGVFAVAMLAEFSPRIESNGPWFYKRLFWETGAIGQTLYLEAEAAGLRGTGIGCFFDDAMHDILGLQDTRYQSLYHFTIGGPVHDGRLRTLDPYSV